MNNGLVRLILQFFLFILKVDTSRTLRPMYGRGRFFRGGVRGGRGMAPGRGGAQRWNAANTKSAAPMQVLSKAQKNKER